ncbi:MAG: hypothetical protein R2873_19200 [Caldilineaceae bacterium]
MTEHRVTVTLPDSVYLRVKETAQAASVSVEEVLAASIMRSLPAVEDDMPEAMRRELIALSILSDEELNDIAHAQMDMSAQQRLEQLTTEQKTRDLSSVEQQELDELFVHAQNFMLRKAESFRLLSLRGFPVFPQIGTEH